MDVEQMIADELRKEAEGETALDDEPETGPDSAAEDDAQQGDDLAEDETGELDEERGEEGDDEEDSLEGDESEEEDEDLEDEDQPEAEDEAPPQVASEVQELRRQLDQLQAELRARRQAEAQAAGGPQRRQRPGPDPRTLSGVKALLSGDQEGFKAFPPEVREEALRRIREANDRQAVEIVDPAMGYANGLGHIVADHVMQLTAPLWQAMQAGKATRAVSQFSDDLAQEGMTKAVQEILETEFKDAGTMPFEKRIKLAIELHRSRSGGKKVAKTKQKLKTRERDLAARQEASRSRGGRKRKRGRKKAPTLEGWDLMSHVNELQKAESQQAASRK